MPPRSHLRSSLLLALLVSGCSSSDTPPKPYTPPSPPPITFPDESFPGADLPEYVDQGRGKILAGKSLTIKRLGRRVPAEGKQEHIGKTVFVAECEGTADTQVSLVLIYKVAAAEEGMATQHTELGPQSTTASGVYNVASQPIETKEYSGKGDVHAFIMPHENIPKWVMWEQSKEVTALSNIYKVTVPFGKKP
jgi:hypothetical protein